VRRTSVPPPPIEIAAESLFVRLPALALPRGEDDMLALPVVISDAEPEPELEPEPAPEPAPESSPRHLPAPSARPPGEPHITEVDEGWDD
jgi:protein TonB